MLADSSTFSRVVPSVLDLPEGTHITLPNFVAEGWPVICFCHALHMKHAYWMLLRVSFSRSRDPVAALVGARGSSLHRKN